MLSLLFDAAVVLALLGLAWQALTSRDLYAGVIFFIAYGLVMALAWVRLQAPDIALAEAAIGAGLTGVLLLDAVGQMGSETTRRWQGDEHGSAGEID
jgi:energy-converting hydrogenase B subunit D